MRLTSKLTAMAGFCILAFCGHAGCTDDCTGHVDRTPSRPTDPFAGERHYSTCLTGRSSVVIRDIAQAVKHFPARIAEISDSCTAVTSVFQRGDKVVDPEKERKFDTSYKYKKVKWKARVTGIRIMNWTPEAAQESFGTEYGIELHFHCNPASLTDKAVFADGLVFFDGNKIDAAALKQLAKGEWVTFEAILTDYSTRINIGTEATCLYLKGINFTRQ